MARPRLNSDVSIEDDDGVLFNTNLELASDMFGIERDGDIFNERDDIAAPPKRRLERAISQPFRVKRTYSHDTKHVSFARNLEEKTEFCSDETPRRVRTSIQGIEDDLVVDIAVTPITKLRPILLRKSASLNSLSLLDDIDELEPISSTEVFSMGRLTVKMPSMPSFDDLFPLDSMVETTKNTTKPMVDELRKLKNMAISSNAVYGSWILVERFIKTIMGTKREQLALSPESRATTAMLPSTDVEVFGPASSNAESLPKSLRSGIFFVSIYLMSRGNSWKQRLGAYLSTFYSGYLALFSEEPQWPKAANIFFTAMFLTTLMRKRPAAV